MRRRRSDGCNRRCHGRAARRRGLRRGDAWCWCWCWCWRGGRRRRWGGRG
ncbi:hypothetical protein ACFPRL_08165 [Pseudoclavibacter helvolus]